MWRFRSPISRDVNFRSGSSDRIDMPTSDRPFRRAINPPVSSVLFVCAKTRLLFRNKLLQQTGGQNPHRCSPLANKVENIDRGHVGVCPILYQEKHFFLMGDPGSHPRYVSVVPTSPYPKWHVDRFVRFGTAHARRQQTETQTDHATTVTIGRNLCFA